MIYGYHSANNYSIAELQAALGEHNLNKSYIFTWGRAWHIITELEREKLNHQGDVVNHYTVRGPTHRSLKWESHRDHSLHDEQI